MKTKLKTSKLALNKLKISTLNSVQTSKIKGGTTTAVSAYIHKHDKKY